MVTPVISSLASAPWIDVLLLSAPFAAALLAVVPLVGVQGGRTNGALRVTLSLRARTLNVTVLLLSVVLGGLLLAYVLTEFLLEAAP
jgi:hypothetical protein